MTTTVIATLEYNITFNDTINATTETAQDKSYPDEYIVYTTFLVVISTCGVVGNGAFIHVMRTVPYMHTVTNIYLLNLCIADIFFLTLGALMRLLPMYLDYLSLLCLLQNFTTYLSSFASMFTISWICIERYIAICHPMRRRHFQVQRTRCIKHIVMIWILALLFTIPSVIYCYVIDLTMFLISSVVKTVPFFGSLIIIAVSYTMIICKLTCKQTVGEKMLEEMMTSKRRKRRLHVIYMLLVTALVYFICLLPFHLLQYILMANALNSSIQTQTITIFLRISELLLYINASVNPLIYNVMSKQYRRAFKKAFGCLDEKPFKNRYFSTNFNSRNSSVFSIANNNLRTNDTLDTEVGETNNGYTPDLDDDSDQLSDFELDQVGQLHGFDNSAFIYDDSTEVNNNRNYRLNYRNHRKQSTVSFSSFDTVYDLNNEESFISALPVNDQTHDTWL